MAGETTRAASAEEGWGALKEGRWQEAFASFSTAVAASPSPEAFEGLSWVAWWLDDVDGLFRAREQAFRLYREADDAASAARMATWLAADHLDFHGALSVASGWLDRAHRLLTPLPAGPDHGWFAFHNAFMAHLKGDTTTAQTEGARAADLGRRFGVADLEMLGLAVEGMTLVSRAEVSDGMRCLDEASAIALSGEATIPISSAWTCCFLVTACTRVLDFDRAFEWCDRIAEFADRYGSRYMLGFCRAEYATVHLWRGEWDRAEAALEESIEALMAARAPMVAGSLTQLAELRRRQGRLDETEQLLERAGSSGAVLRCRAELALDRGHAKQACDLAERALRGVDEARPVDRVPGLDLLARAQLAAGRTDAAEATVEALERITVAVGTRALAARSTLARGMLRSAKDQHELAKALFEDAMDTFEACRAPYDAARARAGLARTLRALGREEDARREGQAALDRLRDLGAVVEASQVEGLVGDGRRTGEDTRAAAVSPRERDVLSLLAEGLTNREISRRLFISEHTVHRHVTNILRKLDVPSRAAAAAHGIRAGIIEPPGA